MIIKIDASTTQSTNYKYAHKCNADDAFKTIRPVMFCNYNNSNGWKWNKKKKSIANYTYTAIIRLQKIYLPTEPPPTFRLPRGCTGFPDKIFNAWSLPRIIKLTGCDQLFNKRRALDRGNTESRHNFFCTPSSESSISRGKWIEINFCWLLGTRVPKKKNLPPYH